MTTLSISQIEQVKLAKADYHGAASELVATCRATFKPGTKIYWRKNNNIQHGTVMFWNGTAAYPTIHVTNTRTSKSYEVSLNDIAWDQMREVANT